MSAKTPTLPANGVSQGAMNTSAKVPPWVAGSFPSVTAPTTTPRKSGVTVLVDAESAPLMRGAEIDYVDDIMKSGFTIFNPNAVKGCACGSSFQTADGGGQAKCCC